jgi:hypothetical protein
MDKQAIEAQIRLYLYDLTNEAKEHGFNDDDRWQLSMVTEAERKRIEKEYHPAISSKAFPDALLTAFHIVKSRLKQSLNKDEQQMDGDAGLNADLKYIIAYNPKRMR